LVSVQTLAGERVKKWADYIRPYGIKKHGSLRERQKTRIVNPYWCETEKILGIGALVR